MTIVIDSDGLIGISNKDDLHYQASVSLLQQLHQAKAEIIFPATVIAEATAVLQIRLNKFDGVNQILKWVKSGQLRIESVDQAVLADAASFIKESTSKHVTLFDGIVAAIARKYNAAGIFSFDKFYKSKGFKLASEL